MKKLIALTAYLKRLNLVPPEDLDSWVTNAETPLLFDNHIHGLECSRVTYTANFYLERYTGDASLLMAYIACWLMENDEADNNTRTHEELAPPTYNVTSNDEVINAFDIDISIDFIEHIYLIEDKNGGIEFNGKHWTIGDYDLWIAQESDVKNTDDHREFQR